MTVTWGICAMDHSAMYLLEIGQRFTEIEKTLWYRVVMEIMSGLQWARVKTQSVWSFCTRVSGDDVHVEGQDESWLAGTVAE